MNDKETNELPLVTFALFSYNQEQYIREAIEGAFAQTYEPLEIILSDDCSTDRTFEIMQKMAAEYPGPHLVKVRSSTENRGTLSHVLDVAHASSGKYVVVSAGDDISKPHRTERSVKVLEKAGADILTGGAEVFEKYPENVVSVQSAPPLINDHLLSGTPLISQINGATAVYRKDFLTGLPMPDEKILLEDYYFRLFAFWQGKQILAVNDRLILHRVHGSNIGPKGRRREDSNPLARELSLLPHYSRVHDLLVNILNNWDAYSDYCFVEGARKIGIRKDAVQYFWLKSKGCDFSLKEKIKFFRISRGYDNKRGDLLRCLGPVLFNAIIKRQWVFESSRKRSRSRVNHG